MEQWLEIVEIGDDHADGDRHQGDERVREGLQPLGFVGVRPTHNARLIVADYCPGVGGMEYVTWALATRSVSPREYRSTSTTASRRPSFNIRVFAMRSVNCGLRRKSMCRLVVTANTTGPIWDMIAIQADVSARDIITGPASVPPGRPWRSVTE